MEAVMNGPTEPSQLVEQVKAAGKRSIHISEWVLSAQSSVRVMWLEEKFAFHTSFGCQLALVFVYSSYISCSIKKF